MNSTISNVGKNVTQLLPLNSTYLGLELNHSSRLYLSLTKISEDGLWIRGKTIDKNGILVNISFVLHRSPPWRELVQLGDNISVVIHRIATQYETVYIPYCFEAIHSWDNLSPYDKYIIITIEDNSLNLNYKLIDEKSWDIGLYDLFASYGALLIMVLYIIVKWKLRVPKERYQITKKNYLSSLSSLLTRAIFPIHYSLFIAFYASYVPQLNDLTYIIPGITILEDRVKWWWKITAVIPLLLLTFTEIYLFYLGKNRSYLKSKDEEDRFMSDLIRSLALLSITVTVCAALFPKPFGGPPESSLVMILLRITILILMVFTGLFCFSWGINSLEKKNYFLGVELSIAMGALVGIICSIFVSSSPSFILFCSLASVLPYVFYHIHKLVRAHSVSSLESTTGICTERSSKP